MKKFSLFITLVIVLSIFVYGLEIISSDNACTSVRAFISSCKK